jgi:hypothetical protein
MRRDLGANPQACAINTAALGFQAPIEDVIDAVGRAGFGSIAPWRRKVESYDVKAITCRIREAGLAVPGYCRGTYIPTSDHAGCQSKVEAKRSAIVSITT